MNKSRWILIITLVVAATGWGAWTYWQHRLVARDASRLPAAQRVLGTTPEVALGLFQLSRSEKFPAGREREWIVLQRDALLALDRPGELAGLYQARADVILESQPAMLRLYEWFEHSTAGTSAAARILENADMSDPAWVLARARVQLERGMKADVATVLEPLHFSGAQEAERIFLLTNASQSDDARAAILESAGDSEQQDPLVRLARARHFEATGRLRDAAYELGMALDLATDKSPWIHDAAEFFLRNRNSAMAVSIWQKYAATDALSWVRASAWSRFIGPVPLGPAPDSVPAPLIPAVEMLRLLPEGAFFPATEPPAGLPEMEDLFWLRWLATLQAGNLEKARDALMHFPDPQKSVNPILGQLAWRVLQLRVEGRFTGTGCPFGRPAGVPVLAQCEVLDRLSIALDQKSTATALAAGQPDAGVRELAAVFDGPFALPFVLLAAGWDEAALRLAGTEGPPAGNAALTVRWAQALEKCRGTAAALTFLESRPPDTVTDLLRAELLLTLERGTEALTLLQAHAAETGEPGIQVATLTARAQLAAKNYNDALRTILANHDLSLSVPGHELAARIYLAAGDEDKAESVLRKVLKVSPAAKEFIAARAYRKGDLQTARDLRLQLASQFPDRADYRATALAVMKELAAAPETP